MSTPKLRNMTAIYLLHNDKILLLYRQGSKISNNKWIGTAGGHFEEHEINDAKACVLRELEEEVGITGEMLDNLKMRYLTIRRAAGEIRQNYYFFADLRDGTGTELNSNEGVLQWFPLEETAGLEMPFSAEFMLEHYFATGRYNDNIYVGVADGEKLMFTELPEFE